MYANLLMGWLANQDHAMFEVMRYLGVGDPFKESTYLQMMGKPGLQPIYTNPVVEVLGRGLGAYGPHNYMLPTNES
jgi:hypothetical protein